MISLIVAMTPDRVIGHQGKIPWRLPADLKHFRTLTLDKTVIMGRKTYESIGKPLDMRNNVVVSRNLQDPAQDLTWSTSIQNILESSSWRGHEVFVIGGAEVYLAALAYADRLYLTLVYEYFPGDVRFPHFSKLGWKLVESRKGVLDEKNKHPHTFFTLDRVWSTPPPELAGL